MTPKRTIKSAQPKTVNVSLQKDLDNGHKWTETWLMELNVDKCTHLEIHLGHEKAGTNYEINQGNITSTLDKVTSERDQGVTVDTKLANTPTQQSKANRNVVLCMNNTMFSSLYKALVRQYLEPPITVATSAKKAQEK